ncbi:MAG: chemoreceptor glutamine deamidase CheD [Rhodomicrobium sp.]
MRALRKSREMQAGRDDGRTRILLKHSGLLGVRILPGETYMTADPDEVIVTVLGSCVSACIRDPATGLGGMNHFMLPESETGKWGETLSAATRYGNFAMEALINSILNSGCAKSNLEIKLFGGANFTAGPSMIGRKNSEFALRYLAVEGLRAVATDLGGIYGRRIQFHPATGKVARLILKGTSERRVLEEEHRYGKSLQTTSIEGGVELFN